jgi:Churchill protein
MSVIDKVKEETDDTETVTYTHVCKDCAHVIAKHEVFWVPFFLFLSAPLSLSLSLSHTPIKSSPPFWQYEFEVEGDFQKYSMNCMLCGWGEDERSYMPDDPRLFQDPDDY